MQKFIRNLRSDLATQEFLQKSTCGFEDTAGERIKLCCPNGIAIEADDMNDSDSSKLNPVSLLLPSNCGVTRTNPRAEGIIGGESTALNEFPWMAVLEYEANGKYLPRAKNFSLQRQVRI